MILVVGEFCLIGLSLKFIESFFVVESRIEVTKKHPVNEVPMYNNNNNNEIALVVRLQQ